MTRNYSGVLEVDNDRGVIYFHLSDQEQVKDLDLVTLLRICSLPAPIPRDRMLDITHMLGADWSGKRNYPKDSGK